MNWNKYSLFKLPNHHRRFEYIPRYYDPKKEELEKKVKVAEAEAKGERDYRREISFRQHTSDKWGNSEFKSQAMKSNVRLIIIFVIVLIGVYFLFQALDNIAPFIDNQKMK